MEMNYYPNMEHEMETNLKAAEMFFIFFDFTFFSQWKNSCKNKSKSFAGVKNELYVLGERHNAA